jgi:hypothetical protein
MSPNQRRRTPNARHQAVDLRVEGVMRNRPPRTSRRTHLVSRVHESTDACTQHNEEETSRRRVDGRSTPDSSAGTACRRVIHAHQRTRTDVPRAP